MIGMNEEEIKKKMLQQKMQASMEQASQQQVQQAEEMLKSVMSQILDQKARERLSNLKLVKPEVATQLEIYLAQLYQSGQLRERITDEQLVMILRKLTEKRETKIRRK